MDGKINLRSKFYEICGTILIYNPDKEAIKFSLSLVHQLLTNIVSKPKEQKIRVLNTENENIRKKVLNVYDVIKLFFELGYKTSKTNLALLEFTDTDTSKVEILLGVLEDYINHLEKTINYEKQVKEMEANPEVQKLKAEHESKRKIEQDDKPRILKQIEGDKLERLKEKEYKGAAVDAKAKQVNYGAQVKNFKPPVETKEKAGGGAPFLGGG